jgi:cation:H+ antiporter
VDGLSAGLFALGLVLLIVGAELLVRGASSLAARVGLSPLVIGLTVVAYGTSSPELAASLAAATSGRAELAVATTVGSNIFNVLFILGLSALIAPLIVSQRLVRVDVPIMIAVSVLLLVLVWDGALGRVEGAVLLLASVAYTGFAVWQSRRETRQIEEEYAEAFGPESEANPRTPLPVQLALIVGGLAMLVVGARWVVGGAVALANAIGVSELVIGLTIIAAGTSLPEVATSVVAALRGERDIAVGNVVGSNIANIVTILGLTGVVSPVTLPVGPGIRNFDIPVMIAVAVACLPIFFTGRLIGRWEGMLFLGYYAAYTAYLILDATGHDALGAYSTVMLVFVLPLTAVTLIGLAAWAVRGERRERGSME